MENSEYQKMQELAVELVQNSIYRLASALRSLDVSAPDTAAELLVRNVSHFFDRKSGHIRDNLPAWPNNLLTSNYFSDIMKNEISNILIADQIHFERAQFDRIAYVKAILRFLERNSRIQSLASSGLDDALKAIVRGLGIENRTSLSVLDPACGYGNWLLSMYQEFPNSEIKLCGTEISTNIAETTRSIFKACGVESHIEIADSLQTDPFENVGFDLVILEPPLGMIQNQRPKIRFVDEVSPGVDAWPFLEIGLRKLKDSSDGSAALIAVVSRKDLQGEGRNSSMLKWATSQDMLRAVVALPRGITGETGASLYMVVLQKAKPRIFSEKVQLIDLRVSYQEIPGVISRLRRVSKEGLNELERAIKTPKPERNTRTLNIDELMVNRWKISFPDCDYYSAEAASNVPEFKEFVPFGRVIESPKIDANIKHHCGRYITENLSEFVSWLPDYYFKVNGSTNKIENLSSTEYSTVPLTLLAKSLFTYKRSSDILQHTNELTDESIILLGIPNHQDLIPLYRMATDLPKNKHQYSWIECKNQEFGELVFHWLQSEKGSRALHSARLKAQTNSELGRLSSISGENSVKLLSHLFVPVPLGDSYRKSLNAIKKTDEVITELKALQNEAWSSDAAANKLVAASKVLTGDRELHTWDDELPYPLASAIRTLATMNLDDEKYAQQLVHFWEALLTFIATYFLSALKVDAEIWKSEIPKLSEFLKTNNLSFENATIATWRITIEICSTFFLSKITSDDESERVKYLGLLGNPSERWIEIFLGKEFKKLASEANRYRNELVGHSGTYTEKQAFEKREKLTSLTNAARSLIRDVFLEFPFINAGETNFKAGQRNVQAQVLMGSRTSFAKEWMPCARAQDLETNEYHLINERGFVKLLPFIHLGPAPAEIANTCYFYSRRENNQARMVAYHLADQNSNLFDNVTLMSTIQDLLNLKPRDVTELL